MHHEDFEELVFIETAHSWLGDNTYQYSEPYLETEEEEEILFI